jgi:predicted transcriptional regulator
MRYSEVCNESCNDPWAACSADLRKAAEEVLNENESLSSFMEASLRESIAKRRLQREFVARGLAARDEAQRTGEYFDADDVHAELASMLQAARTAGKDH